ncbi:hypothetical protein CDAR_570271 [Caerostris darwini]|uniref:Secreted protein n=1 Tax=Caerostris darwini TaxID=1538125 RepID=A0AAV4PB72_9ARAC|nr:hypothetical protein CDAR_570271 [Caerostris darwini]
MKLGTMQRKFKYHYFLVIFLLPGYKDFPAIHTCSVTLGHEIGYPISNNSTHSYTHAQIENGCRRREYHTRTREKTVLLPFFRRFPLLVLLSWVVKKDPVFVTWWVCKCHLFPVVVAKRPPLTIPPTRKINVGIV